MFLRPLDPHRDAPALHEIFGDEESCLYMPGPATASVAETEALLVKWTGPKPDTSWAVCDAPDGEALGRIALFTQGRDVWEAACMMRPMTRGRGLAPAALAVAIEKIFETRAARRVFADIDPDNRASIRTFEKLGFTREGVLRGNWLTHIGERDSVIMGLMASDPRPWTGLKPA
jgi:RimJ/RimL family protein N-acetyltransferase